MPPRARRNLWLVDEPVVAVRGEVRREVPPEIARFNVEVTARDADRQTALSRLTDRAEGLRALLAEYADAIERRETSGMYLHPDVRKGRGERVTAYQGSLTTTVTVSDFDTLGELMLRLANQEQTRVYGPWWSVRSDSPAHREARRAAIADGIARAKDYAEAVGARLVRLVEISDVAAETHLFATPMGFRGGGDEALSLELEPQVQTVHAQVALKFTMTEPTV